MAEITKITTPIVPQENIGSKNKPVSDQAFELTDPSKVHKTAQNGNDRVRDQQGDGGLLRDGIGRDMMAPLLRSPTELVQAFQKVAVMLQMGISTSQIMDDPEVQRLLSSLFLHPDDLAQALVEQDASAVLFKGSAFDVLRDIMAKFGDNPKVHDAMANLLKVFEHNINTTGSLKTILLNCQNLLDYMFSADRAQFSEYLQGLSEMLLPQTDPDGRGSGGQGREQELGMDQREAAQILKGNLLPLLGEIVVKYNQSERIRDMVMVVVHNIVRVDQGTPEALREAIARLVSELRQIATLPDNFEQQLVSAILRNGDQVKNVQNETMDKLVRLISEALTSQDSSPATLRQAENLLMSMLQNQSAMMNLLHFVLPMETQNGKLFAEMYVDPDSDEKVGRSQEKSRKLFLAFESDSLGSFELCFLESDNRVDFSLWCPDLYVKSLSGIKRQISEVMQLHGYALNGYSVAELVVHHNIAEVFPRLLERRLGIDVRI